MKGAIARNPRNLFTDDARLLPALSVIIINPRVVIMAVSIIRLIFIKAPFDGGFKIDYVKNIDGSDASYLINQTMMRLNLDKPLASGEKFSFKIKWWYNINNHIEQGGRSGFEHFPADGNNNCAIFSTFGGL